MAIGDTCGVGIRDLITEARPPLPVTHVPLRRHRVPQDPHTLSQTPPSCLVHRERIPGLCSCLDVFPICTRRHDVVVELSGQVIRICRTNRRSSNHQLEIRPVVHFQFAQVLSTNKLDGSHIEVTDMLAQVRNPFVRAHSNRTSFKVRVFVEPDTATVGIKTAIMGFLGLSNDKSPILGRCPVSRSEGPISTLTSQTRLGLARRTRAGCRHMFDTIYDKRVPYWLMEGDGHCHCRDRGVPSAVGIKCVER
mmetsp:Transcript_52181/g.124870  ORF Transcript_52181/g.124870 Transcript_52181/m.124870 type:complete len:250 (+) Transcript_52181:471-1220(+)